MPQIKTCENAGKYRDALRGKRTRNDRSLTGGGSLRTAEISKNHIKSTKMAVQKLSPPIERSRRKEFQKNTLKNIKVSETIKIVLFDCP